MCLERKMDCDCPVEWTEHRTLFIRTTAYITKETTTLYMGFTYQCEGRSGNLLEDDKNLSFLSAGLSSS